MLLEVVMAVAILTIAMTIVGSQITTAWEDSYASQELTMAAFLAESKLAELDGGLLTFEDEMDGDFGKSFPGYGWRVFAEPSDTIEGLLEVEISILRGVRVAGEDEYQYGEQSEVLYQLHTLRQKEVATGTTVDLQADFGLSETDLDELEAQNTVTGVDLTNLNLRDLAGMTPEELLRLIPLLQKLGLSMSTLTDMMGEEFKELIDDATGGEGTEGTSGGESGGGTAGGSSGSGGGRRGGRSPRGEGEGSTGAESGEERTPLKPEDIPGFPDRLPTLEEFEELMEGRK